jgi:3-oxoadipate enol-lactonase
MFIRAGDIDIHVQVSGPRSAPPLLLLHSIGTNLHVWDGPADALSTQFRVIRPDMRGHGLTTLTPGPYTMPDLANDALSVLDLLDVGRAHVAGLSIGGLIAQALAARAHERVASLILCDTAMAIPPPETWVERAATVRAAGTQAVADATMARWVTGPFMEMPDARGLRTMLLRTPAEGYAAAAEAIGSADLTESTRRLCVPSLVLVGEHDPSTPVAAAEELRAALGGSLEVIPGAAHLPTVERPLEVASAIRRFLASTLKAASE